MDEYKFDVDLVVTVRVRAPDEATARKVIPTVVTPPSEAIIGVINRPNAVLGVEAAVTGVALSLEKNATLVEVNGGDDGQAKGRQIAPFATNLRGFPSGPLGKIIHLSDRTNLGMPMQEYVFEVDLVAVVTVNAETEAHARDVVVSSALGSPSAEEIRLANQADFLKGKEALIIGIDFAVDESSVKLIADAPEGGGHDHAAPQGQSLQSKAND